MKERSEWAKLALFGMITSQLIGFPAVGWWLAGILRDRFSWPSWTDGVGIGVGFFLALFQIWTQIKGEADK